MSFRDLYDLVQQHTGRVSTRWLKEEAIRLSTIAAVKEQWSALVDPEKLRGFYIEGPLGPPVPLLENEALIVLSREMIKDRPGGDHWRRFIYTKELMHVFDTEEEKAGTPEDFDRQMDRFANPSAPTSAQFMAEVKAMWRALAVLCPKALRDQYKQELAESKVSLEVVATALHMPVSYARNLFRDDFDAIIATVMD